MTQPRTSDDEPSLLETLRLAMAAARATYEQARELLRNRPQQVRRWRRTDVGWHPDWCAKDHTCTAQPGHMAAQPEHRSPTHPLMSPHCSMLATRIEPHDDRRPYLELVVRVPLSRDSRHAFAQSLYAPVAVSTALGALLAQLATNFTLARLTAGPAPRQALAAADPRRNTTR